MYKKETKTNQQYTSAFRLINYILIFLVTSFIYFITARFSLSLAVVNSNVSPVWPPSGIALAAILVFGYRISPAIFFGAFFANIFSLKGISTIPAFYLSASFSTAIGNMLEGMVGAYFIRRFTGMHNPFENIKGLFIFVTLGCLVSTMISATCGVLSLSIITGNWLEFYELWITWWLGDATGILVVSPVFIMLINKMRLKFNKSNIFEAIFVYLVLISSTVLIFWESYHLEFLIIPILLWIAYRFGRFEVAISIVLVSAITIASTINGVGPLTDMDLKKTLLYLQSYIGVIAVITLCLSVLKYERSKAEGSRLAVQKQLYDIIDFLPDATFAIDKVGKVIAWNKAIEDMTGVAKDEIIGKGNYEYSIPFYKNRRPILIDLLNISNEEMEKNYKFVNRNGGVITAETYIPLLHNRNSVHLWGIATPLYDVNGNRNGAIEAIRDVTEQKRIEEALRTSERKYRELVMLANTIILHWSYDGRIIYMNEYGLKFFGYTEAEVLGRHVIGTLVPESDSTGRDLRPLMESICAKPEQFGRNINENILKNGERVWIDWANKVILDGHGQVKEILSVGSDITERKNAEEQIRNLNNELQRYAEVLEQRVAERTAELASAMEKAQAADRIKSAFLATMSHELRTPLNSIIGFTGIILQRLAGPLNEEQDKQMQMLQNSARHLLSLINDVLDISKIEAGQLELIPKPFELKPSIEKTVKLISSLAEKKGLGIDIDYIGNAGTITADQRRIEQIILNLLNNAVKFTEKGSIRILCRINDGRCILSVADTGIGIAQEEMPGLFQPFHQVDTGLSRKAEGTGLGLSICKKILDMMGGTIEVQSKPGEGSIFTINFPSGIGGV
jgi:PAS domain S-box-containing protein